MLVSAGHHRVVNLDKLTYAGNLDNLEPIADKPNYRFVRGDITDSELIDTLIDEEQSRTQSSISQPSRMSTAAS